MSSVRHPSSLFLERVFMKARLLMLPFFCTLFLVFITIPNTSAGHTKKYIMPEKQGGAPSDMKPARDEKLWNRALDIQRKAIVIDTHNDVTTPMTNDDYDLSGTPPTPYRTSIARMKEGGLTAEFFSIYIKPHYV